MSYLPKLNELINNSVIPDIEERIDELYVVIADKRNSLLDEVKEELEELAEFRDDLKDILNDIQCGEITEDECKEIMNDILQAQAGNDDKR